MGDFLLTEASDRDDHYPLSDHTRDSLPWLTSLAPRSEHSLFCSDGNMSRRINRIKSEAVAKPEEEGAVLTPAPIRPLLSKRCFPRLSSRSLDARCNSTDMRHTSFTAATRGIHTPRRSEKHLEFQLSAEVFRPTEAMMPTDASSFLPMNEDHSTRSVSKRNSAANSNSKYKAKRRNSNVMSSWKGNTTDDQTIFEFFSVSGSDFWLENLGADCGIQGVNSINLSMDSVISTGAAQTFQRNGARTARVAGPGSDQPAFLSLQI